MFNLGYNSINISCVLDINLINLNQILNFMKRLYKVTCGILFICFCTLTSFAQDRVVSGLITDEQKQPLTGAAITVKGTRISAVVDGKGIFKISVPKDGKILLVNYIGKITKEIAITNQNFYDVVLFSSSTSLSEVLVNVGYGTQKKSDVNGSISTLTAKDLENSPQVSIDQMLQGKAAGVTISQNSGAPGSNTSVHIRGITSLSLSSEPLYVIDGIPVYGDANNTSTSGRSTVLNNKGEVGAGNGESTVSPLALLNPSDIESIEILKDASSAGIYGSRASNGVILITTKKGKTGSKINYDGYYGLQQQGKFLDVMNLKQYAVLQNALADKFGVQRRAEFASPELLGEGTNWQEEVFRVAPQQSHQISLSGAKDGTDYYFSGGYLNQDGTILESNFNRYSFRSNINSQIKPWFKAGIVVSGSKSGQKRGLSDGGGIIYNALLSSPSQAVRNLDGKFAGPQLEQNGAVSNPIAQALDITNTLSRSNLNGTMYGDIKFFKDLTLRSELNGDFNYSEARQFLPTFNYGPLFVNATSKLTEYYSNSVFWAWKEYLTYNHVFADKHDLTALLGYEVNQSRWGGNDASVLNFLSNDLQTLNLGDAKTATNNEYKDSQALESFFGRVNYTFNRKYSLTATIRSDRSSKFAPGYQTGYFPSAAVSWRISEEPFMASIKNTVDNIKIRASYGAVGNQAIPNYRYGSALTALPTGLGTGFAIDKVPSPQVKWESALQTDIGLDFSLFKGRIDATIDYFSKTSKDFLFRKPLPAFLVGQSAEYSSNGVIAPPYINGGKVSNKGIEFNITSKNVVSNNFTWNTTLIFSKYKNKVISITDDVPFIIASATNGFLNLPISRTQPGSSIGEFYGFRVKDIFRTQAQLVGAPIQFGRPISNTSGGTWLGDIQYEDINGDGKIDDADQAYIGNPNPDFTYSIANNFTYKNFDLSVFLNGSYGAKIYNVLNYKLANLAALYSNQLASSANFWTPENPTSNIPAPKTGDNANLKNSDRFIENGSYLRLQNVTLGYSVPTKLLEKVKLARLKIYVSGQNLFVITPYKGLDPELGGVNQDVFLTNVDLGRYPSPRVYTFGINAQF